MQSIRIAVLALALCFGASLLPVQSHAAAPLPKVKILQKNRLHSSAFST